jgi:hypothetical protein
MANIFEAMSKDIDEKSKSFSCILVAYIIKKMLPIIMKIGAIGTSITESRNNGRGTNPGMLVRSRIVFAIVEITPNTIQKKPEYIKSFPKFSLFLIPKNKNNTPKVISNSIFGTITLNADCAIICSSIPGANL